MWSFLVMWKTAYQKFDNFEIPKVSKNEEKTIKIVTSRKTDRLAINCKFLNPIFERMLFTLLFYRIRKLLACERLRQLKRTRGINALTKYFYSGSTLLCVDYANTIGTRPTTETWIITNKIPKTSMTTLL